LYTAKSSELILSAEDIWAPSTNYDAYMAMGALRTWQFNLQVEMSKRGNSHADVRIRKALAINAKE
jgi:hypothetical protein